MWDFDGQDERFDHVATPTEAMHEWARNIGSFDRFANQQWLLSDYDVWVQNPHYRGPRQPHPESYTYEEAVGECFADGTPVDLFDDDNWGRNRRVA